ncbi:MAG: CapA family protein [Actinomycetota bacterium]|nr:CapA family protein [Actinomycetota bacterium]
MHDQGGVVIVARQFTPYALALGLGAAVVGVLAVPGPDAETRATLAAGESPLPVANVVPRPDAGALRASHTRTRADARRMPVTLAFAGDVHFEGVVRRQLDADTNRPLDQVAGLLRSADLTIANLETAVTIRGTPESKQYVFRAPAKAFDALSAAGVDVVTLANNHGLDYGQVGLSDTLAAGRAAHVAVVGAGRDETAAFAPFVANIRGQRIAVIGATQVLDDKLASRWSAGPGKPGLASAKHERVLIDAVRKARSLYDTVVVYLHWGRELSNCPIPAQRDIAAKLAAAGADLVVGSHAHVTLGAGYLASGRRRTYVDYGLGNFLFYTSGNDATSHAGILTVTLSGHGVSSAQWHPTFIADGRTYAVAPNASGQAVRDHDAQRGCTGLSATP